MRRRRRRHRAAPKRKRGLSLAKYDPSSSSENGGLAGRAGRQTETGRSIQGDKFGVGPRFVDFFFAVPSHFTAAKPIMPARHLPKRN